MRDMCIFVVCMCAFSALTLIVFWLLSLSADFPTDHLQWIDHYKKHILILCIGGPIFHAIALLNIYKNQYTLVRDNLIVKEYMFFYKTIDAHIPLSTIDEVKITQTFNHPMKHIQLRTANATYDLSCITYRDELYKELANRLITRHANTQTLFYKQRKS